MHVSRYVNVVGGLLFLLASVVFAVLVVAGTLYSVPGNTLHGWHYVLITLLLLVFIEAGWFLLRTSWSMRDGRLAAPEATVASRLAFWNNVGEGILLTGGLVFIVGFAVVAIRTITPPADGVHFSSSFWILVATVVAYPVALRPIAMRLKAVLDRRTMPSFTFDDAGITLDLAWNTASQQRPPPVRIAFSELTDVRIVSFAEAETIKQNMGPDIAFAVEAARSMYQYANGSIPRPTHYEAVQSGGSTLVLHGPGLLYLLTATGQDVDGLLAAFRRAHTKKF